MQTKQTEKEIIAVTCEVWGCVPSTLFTEDREEIETICARCGNLL